MKDSYIGLAAGLAALVCAGSADAAPTRRAMEQETTPTTKIVPAPAASAAQPEWIYLGPEQAAIRSMAVSPINPDILIASMSAPDAEDGYAIGWGMYRTDTGGSLWLDAYHSFYRNFDFQVNGVNIDDQGVALAATSQGMYSSTDGGTSWTFYSPFPWGPMSYQHVEGGTSPNADVWAVATARPPTGNPRLIRTPRPGIDPWTVVTPALPEGFGIRAIAVSDLSHGTAAIGGRGYYHAPTLVWITHDNGNSWTARGETLSRANIQAMRWLGNRLLVAMGEYPLHTESGLFASDDFGETWTQIYGGDTSGTAVNDVAIDPLNEDRLWIATQHEGVQVSLDGGSTWQLSATELAGKRVTHLRYDDSAQRLWAAVDYEGIWLSTDGGTSFAPRSLFLNATPATTVAVNPLDVNEVVVVKESIRGGAAQLAVSTDGGVEWSLQSHPHATRTRFDGQGQLYVTFDGHSGDTLYRRNNEGEWQHIGLEASPAHHVHIDDMNFGAQSGTLLMTGFIADSATPHSLEFNIWRSIDNGQSWSPVVHGIEHSPFHFGSRIERVEALSGTRLIALVRSWVSGDSSRVLASDDDGVTWHEVASELPAWIHGALCVGTGGNMALAVEEVPHSSMDWQSKLYRSTDAGTTWTPTAWNSDPTHLNDAVGAIHCPGNGSEIFAAAEVRGVLHSTDGGNTFEPESTGLEWFSGWVDGFTASPRGLYMAGRQGVWLNEAYVDPGLLPSGLQVDVLRAHMRTRATLTWNGGASSVDVRRKGLLIATVPNSGRHIDNVMVFEAQHPMEWQVCNAGTNQCSPVVHD